MSKYFTYRALDDLRADIAARGVDIDLTDGVDSLLRPLQIDTRTLGNRLAVHPMEGCDGEPDGRPGELTFQRWERFGAGGAKLIWGEATAIVPEGRANPRQLVINHGTAPDLARLAYVTRAAHKRRFGDDSDLIIGLQLTHSGRFSSEGPIIAQHAPPLDAVKSLGPDHPLIGDEELERLGETYIDAAELAAGAGFDFVDIKQCHTYLLNEILGSRDRHGPYGGPFENRTRFVLDVIRGIRDRIGPRLIIGTRLNVYDGPPFVLGPDGVGIPVSDRPYRWGFGTNERHPVHADLTEPIALVGMLRGAGVRLVNVTMGSPYFNAHIGRPFERAPIDGYVPPEHPLEGVARHFALASEIQRAHPDIVAIGTGYSWLRHYAPNAGAANITAGRISMMGLGRGALAYPDFAADLMEHGHMIDRKSCIGVSYCTTLMRSKKHELGQFPVGCVPRDPYYAEQFKLAEAARRA